MNIAIIFAGGTGRRMQTEGIPKQFLKINEIPVIIHTLKKFMTSEVDAIVIVMLEEYITYMQYLVTYYQMDKVVKIVKGGATGQLSIYNGLKAAYEIDPEALVLIHDGVRPIFENDLIKRNIESVKKYGSAISSVPCNETIALADDEMIKYLPNRSFSWISRAPQSFWLKDILRAHEQALKNNDQNVTDSCTMMQKYGNNKNLHIVKTIYENIKITTPADYFLVEALMKYQQTSDILGFTSEAMSLALKRM